MEGSRKREDTVGFGLKKSVIDGCCGEGSQSFLVF